MDAYFESIQNLNLTAAQVQKEEYVIQVTENKNSNYSKKNYGCSPESS